MESNIPIGNACLIIVSFLVMTILGGVGTYLYGRWWDRRHP